MTQDELKRLLKYSPLTGKFVWLVPPRGKAIGATAGSTNKVSGYVVIYIYGKAYYAHRLAWFYTYGEWPSKCVDHKNEKRDDNRIKNLRDVSSGTNLLNRTAEGLGVSFRNDRNTWTAYIGIDEKTIQLGTFPTKEEALAARHAAKKVFNHFRK